MVVSKEHSEFLKG